MKRFLTVFSLAVLGLMTSCYDDTLLQNSLTDLTDRVEKLETLCTEMNTNIASLQAIVNAGEMGEVTYSVL